MGRRGHPAEFRRRALELIMAGRKVADAARDLDVSDQTLFAWRRQGRIDRGLEPGASSHESVALAAANEPIRWLGTGWLSPTGSRAVRGADAPPEFGQTPGLPVSEVEQVRVEAGIRFA